ncbi:endonuclease/exonuclease/phosphatase family protein [Cobetia crustatorum]|uniref:endonuclease/exonuclease/phosphatase family protein n=1 Tax=Cobetia crustatorum TaxID=553385 RepID=UPI001C980B16|nr:endonuclease/exonuclease/phosphatase family protein [Cobetia crustatorum]
MILSLLGVLTLLMALFTLLPLTRLRHWSVRVMDFPRLQLAVLWAVLLLADLCIGDLSLAMRTPLVLIALAGVIYQAHWILPYTRLYPCESGVAKHSDPQRHVRLLTANVLTTNHESDKLLAIVKREKPDVLVTLESDDWWQERLDVLEANTPDYGYCHTLKCPLDNLYGMHVYSRLPLHDASIDYLVEEGVPSMHAQLELKSGDRIRVHFLHPAPPSPTENEESSERDAELVIVARSVARSRQPVIVTGDLNDVAWSRTTHLFRKLSGLLDPRVGRGMFNTFHANLPLLRWPLDHLFHSSHFSVVRVARMEAFGSDHFPLLTELALTPNQDTSDTREAPEADAEDHAEATETARSEDVSHHDVPSPGR